MIYSLQCVCIWKENFEVSDCLWGGIKTDTPRFSSSSHLHPASFSEPSRITCPLIIQSTLADQNLKYRHFQRPRNETTCDDNISKSSPGTIEGLHQLLKARTEAMDACLYGSERSQIRQALADAALAINGKTLPKAFIQINYATEMVDNAELRQAVGELTTSLKQLQMENENLRQRLTGNMGAQANSSSNGPRTWSFSSESIPNTPCSPPDTVRQTNFRLVNGQPYSTLS
ncbi:hypothetical protein Aperf_G00000109119 [Anoplocephala perfoliata]